LNPRVPLILPKLFIPRSDKSDKNGKDAEPRYTAGTYKLDEKRQAGQRTSRQLEPDRITCESSFGVLQPAMGPPGRSMLLSARKVPETFVLPEEHPLKISMLRAIR
jgi:hypothetical protein